MNIRQIEIFWAIMRTGSVTGASRLLGISQPAVSKLLKHTEDNIGIKLFLRRSGKLYPTPEADHLFVLADVTFDNIEKIKQAVIDFRYGMSGRIQVVSTPTLGASVIPNTLNRFFSDHPNIKLSLKLLPVNQVISRVALQQADIGLMHGPLIDDSLVGEKIYDGSVVCALHVSNPLSKKSTINVNDLQKERIISFQRTAPWGVLVQGMLEKAEVPLSISIECSHATTVFAMVDAKIGTGVMVRVPGLREQYPNIVLRPIAPRVEIDPLVIYRRTPPLGRLGLALLDTLRRTVAGL